MYQRVGDLQSAEALVLRLAPKLIGQGRWKVVLEWIEALPLSRVQANCWLMHWLGTASINIAPLEAREKLEYSFKLAEDAKDDLCQLQTAAGIIENYMVQYTHFRPLDRWIAVLENRMTGQEVLLDPDIELRLQSALLMALAARQPSNPRLHWCVERIFALLQISTDVNLCLYSVAHLVCYGSSSGPLDVSRRGLSQLEVLLNRPQANALNAAWALVAVSWFHCLCYDVPACRAACQQVERIGEEHGLPWIARLAVINRMWLELFKFDAVDARKWVERTERIINWSHPFDLATLHGAKAWLALCEDKPDTALDYALKSVQVFDEAGSAMQRINYRVVVVMSYFKARKFGLARQWAEEMREIAGQGITAWQQSSVLMWEANIARATGDQS